MTNIVNINNIDFNKSNITFIDGLTLELAKIKYYWLFNAKIKDAIVGEDSYGLVWYSGEWICGEWKNGTWYSGTFYNGTWLTGKWYSYKLNKFDLMLGRFTIMETNNTESIFKGGTWYTGDFYSGSFGECANVLTITFGYYTDILNTYVNTNLYTSYCDLFSIASPIKSYYRSIPFDNKYYAIIDANSSHITTMEVFKDIVDNDMNWHDYIISVYSNSYAIIISNLKSALYARYPLYIDDINNLKIYGYDNSEISNLDMSTAQSSYLRDIFINGVVVIGAYGGNNSLYKLGQLLTDDNFLDIKSGFTYNTGIIFEKDALNMISFGNYDYFTTYATISAITSTQFFTQSYTLSALTENSSPIWKNGNFYNGLFNSAIWEYGYFRNGIMSDSAWLNGDVYNGTITNGTRFFTGNMYGGNFNSSIWYNGVADQKIQEVPLYIGNTTASTHNNVTYWLSGITKFATIMSGLYINSDNEFIPTENNSLLYWKDGSFVNGDIYGGIFEKIVIDYASIYGGLIGYGNTNVTDAILNDGLFYNGYFKGTINSGYVIHGLLDIATINNGYIGI